jgi:predicted metalloprotease with PDZ domain
VVAALGAALLGACARDAAVPARSPPEYAYVLSVPGAGSWDLVVEATLERAPSEMLVAAGGPAGMHEVALLDAGGAAHVMQRRGDAWIAPECRGRGRCRVRYKVDLAAARWTALGGNAVIGTAAAWLLVPEPSGDAVLRVRVGAGDRARFATGLRRANDGTYVLRASELGEAAYTAIGEMRTSRLSLSGASVDVALLGQPLAMTDRAALEWVRNSATCVAGLFGRFPADATVFVVPVAGADEVVFGRVLSLAGASVALLFGAETRADAVHDDWVVVHELFHLGTPTFVGEGHWLEEGLATYYEPILRERAGWMSEADLWGHFVREMPRGVRTADSPPSIEDRDDIDSTYWGGALFAFLADVQILQETRRQRSLDDGLRASLALEGDATHQVRVRDFLRTCDEATGTRALARLYDDFALRGTPVDLDALWRSLGVDRERGSGRIVLREDAPLAAVRRAIATGYGH